MTRCVHVFIVLGALVFVPPCELWRSVTLVRGTYYMKNLVNSACTYSACRRSLTLFACRTSLCMFLGCVAVHMRPGWHVLIWFW